MFPFVTPRGRSACIKLIGLSALATLLTVMAPATSRADRYGIANILRGAKALAGMNEMYAAEQLFKNKAFAQEFLPKLRLNDREIFNALGGHVYEGPKWLSDTYLNLEPSITLGIRAKPIYSNGVCIAFCPSPVIIGGVCVKYCPDGFR